MLDKKVLVYVTDSNGIKPRIDSFRDYKDMQNFVNGLIELVPIPFVIDDVQYDVFVNEEGLYTETYPSMVLYNNGEIYSVVKGNFFISKSDSFGESVSLSDDEIMKIREYVARNTHMFSYKNENDEKMMSKLFVAHY